MRKALWILVVPACWYSVVILVFPDLPDCAVALLKSKALACLGSHTLMVCAEKETFGDRSTGSTLARFDGQSVYGNSYNLSFARASDGQVTGVILYPTKHRSYKHGVAKAIIFLKTSMATFPTYVMLPNGDIFENIADGFDASYVPSLDVVDDVATSAEWIYVQNYRDHEWCTAAAEAPIVDTSGEQP